MGLYQKPFNYWKNMKLKAIDRESKIIKITYSKGYE